MATVFISYSRDSQEQAKSIAADLEALGHQAWFDQALTGGQAWWDLILSEIQKCDIFAFALEPESLTSAACKCEYTYASKLGKSILPVLVADGVATDLLPSALVRIQFVDYRREDKEAFRALAKALTTLPPSAPLPEPLPEPPPAPVSYLGGLREQVEAPEGLSFAEQTGLLVRLKSGLRNAKDAENIRTLLKYFRGRDDLYAKVADEIDTLLAEAPGQSARTKESQSPSQPVLNAATTPGTIIPPAKGILVDDAANTGSAEYKPPNVRPFRLLSFKAFWLPIILGVAAVAAAIFVGPFLNMNDRMLISVAGFMVYLLLIIVVRLIRRRRHKKIRNV